MVSEEALQTKIKGEAAINKILVKRELCLQLLYGEFGGREKDSGPHLTPDSKAVAEIVFRAKGTDDAEWAHTSRLSV